jgi:membrane-associated phospholipid phosphatase
MTRELFIRILADGSLVPIVLLGAYALIFKVPKGQRLQSYTRILMAGLTAYLVAKLISVVYQPSGERPFEVLGTVAGASFLNNPGFPSDHALFVTAITCAVWFETRQKVITIILIGLTIAVCVGRILALVHTPADVIGGIVIALIGSLWYVNDRPQSAK